MTTMTAMTPSDYEGACCGCGARSLFLRDSLRRWWCLMCVRRLLDAVDAPQVMRTGEE